MALRFTKMHGLGNDFVVIDALHQQVDLSPERIQKLADRNIGIGFDQLLIIEPATSNQYHFRYRIFNANGGEVEQCGNGARCVAQYIFTEKLPHKDSIVLETIAGAIILKREADNQITVNMGKPCFSPEAIPLLVEKQLLEYELVIEGSIIRFGAVSFGNPHAVIKVNDVSTAPVQRIGQLLQQHAAFPKQVNVGFMQVMSRDHIRLRVYERGVGETKACGSGACAAMVIGKLCHQLSATVRVELPGGNLSVYWQSPDQDVYLTGPAEKIYKGELIT